MASIDKLRFKDYFDYDEFLIWIQAYYPKLLFGITDKYLSESDWNARKIVAYEHDLAELEKERELLGLNSELSNKVDAELKLIELYRDHQYNCSQSRACWEVASLIDNLMAIADRETYINNLELNVANFSQDFINILKWRCPCKSVRNYLHHQCGVSYKNEWFYKKFFKGKKYIC